MHISAAYTAHFHIFHGQSQLQHGIAACKVTHNSSKKAENFLPFNIFLLILHL